MSHFFIFFNSFAPLPLTDARHVPSAPSTPPSLPSGSVATVPSGPAAGIAVPDGRPSGQDFLPFFSPLVLLDPHFSAPPHQHRDAGPE